MGLIDMWMKLRDIVDTLEKTLVYGLTNVKAMIQKTITSVSQLANN